jgi:hypothetical protein
MSTTGKRIGKVSFAGIMWVDIKARDEMIVAAQRNHALLFVSLYVLRRYYTRDRSRATSTG